MSDAVPPEFSPLFRTSPFLDAVGPLYHRGTGSGMSIGFRVAAKHTNARGHLHGGVVATVADVSLSFALAMASDPPGSFVTASLSVDFVGGASIGDWIHTAVDVQKIGSRLAFANAFFFLGETRIARASGVFAGVDPARAG
jgi:acyl-coenzyme A thioesterase 13